MSVTLWIDESSDAAIDIGETFAAYKAFAEMAHIAGAEWDNTYEALSGVLMQCERGEDADPEWFADVRKQSRQFLLVHSQLTEDARSVLESLAHSDRTGRPGRRSEGR